VTPAHSQTNQASQRLREKLEDDLSAAKTNSIRESMRRGQMDLGDFHYRRGAFLDASKCYMRARDYCNTPKQVSRVGVKGWASRIGGAGDGVQMSMWHAC